MAELCVTQPELSGIGFRQRNPYAVEMLIIRLSRALQRRCGPKHDPSCQGPQLVLHLPANVRCGRFPVAPLR